MVEIDEVLVRQAFMGLEFARVYYEWESLDLSDDAEVTVTGWQDGREFAFTLSFRALKELRKFLDIPDVSYEEVDDLI